MLHPSHSVLHSLSFPRIFAADQSLEQRQAFVKRYPNGIPAGYSMIAKDADEGSHKYLENNLPVGFYTNPPIQAPAIFSSMNGQQPFRKMEHILPRRALRLWSRNEIQSVCNSLRKRYWETMKHMEKSSSWDDLWTYFDAYDLYHHGSMNLWNVINHLYDENKIINSDVLKESAMYIGQWVDKWLESPNNCEKLQSWADTKPIILVLAHKDWASLGKLPDEMLPLVANALSGQRHFLRTGKPSLPNELPGILSACRMNNVENWLVGQKPFPGNGLPPCSEEVSSKTSSASLAEPIPCIVQNGKHYYLHPRNSSLHSKSRTKTKPKSAVQALQQSVEAATAKRAPKLGSSTYFVVNGTVPPCKNPEELEQKPEAKRLEEEYAPTASSACPVAPELHVKHDQSMTSQASTTVARQVIDLPRRNSDSYVQPRKPPSEYSGFCPLYQMCHDVERSCGRALTRSEKSGLSHTLVHDGTHMLDRSVIRLDSEIIKSRRVTEKMVNPKGMEEQIKEFEKPHSVTIGRQELSILPQSQHQDMANTSHSVGILARRMENSTYAPCDTLDPKEQQLPAKCQSMTDGTKIIDGENLDAQLCIAKMKAPWLERKTSGEVTHTKQFERTSSISQNRIIKCSPPKGVPQSDAWQSGLAAQRKEPHKPKNTKHHRDATDHYRQMESDSWQNLQWSSHSETHGQERRSIVCHNQGGGARPREYNSCNCTSCVKRNRTAYVRFQEGPQMPPSELMLEVKAGMRSRCGPIERILTVSSHKATAFMVQFYEESSVPTALELGELYLENESRLVILPVFRSKWVQRRRDPKELNLLAKGKKFPVKIATTLSSTPIRQRLQTDMHSSLSGGSPHYTFPAHHEDAPGAADVAAFSQLHSLQTSSQQFPFAHASYNSFETSHIAQFATETHRHLLGPGRPIAMTEQRKPCRGAKVPAAQVSKTSVETDALSEPSSEEAIKNAREKPRSMSVRESGIADLPIANASLPEATQKTSRAETERQRSDYSDLKIRGPKAENSKVKQNTWKKPRGVKREGPPPPEELQLAEHDGIKRTSDAARIRSTTLSSSAIGAQDLTQPYNAPSKGKSNVSGDNTRPPIARFTAAEVRDRKEAWHRISVPRFQRTLKNQNAADSRNASGVHPEQTATASKLNEAYIPKICTSLELPSQEKPQHLKSATKPIEADTKQLSCPQSAENLRQTASNDYVEGVNTCRTEDKKDLNWTKSQPIVAAEPSMYNPGQNKFSVKSKETPVSHDNVSAQTLDSRGHMPQATRARGMWSMKDRRKITRRSESFCISTPNCTGVNSYAHST